MRDTYSATGVRLGKHSNKHKGVADRNFKRPSGPRLPTTCLRVTSLMLRPSLGAACLAWQIGPPVGFGAEPSAVAGPPSQRAAPPATLLAPPSLSFRLEKETTVAAVNPRHPPRSASPESWPGMPELVAGMDIMESLYLTLPANSPYLPLRSPCGCSIASM